MKCEDCDETFHEEELYHICEKCNEKSTEVFFCWIDKYNKLLKKYEQLKEDYNAK